MVSQIFQIWICLENMRDYFWSFYGHFWPFDKDQMRVFLPREFGLILHDFPKHIQYLLQLFVPGVDAETNDMHHCARTRLFAIHHH